MTESEWLASGDPSAMLRHFDADSPHPWRRPPSERKLRLFACACLRRLWPLLTDRRSRDAVEVAERFADGLATRDELDDAAWRAQSAFRDATGHEGGAEIRPQFPAHCGCDSPASVAADFALGPLDTPEEKREQAALLREVVGNPFRSVTLPPAEHLWHDGVEVRSTPILSRHRYATPAVLSLATAAYEDRLPAGTLDPLTLLAVADALEEAGCVVPREPCDVGVYAPPGSREWEVRCGTPEPFTGSHAGMLIVAICQTFEAASRWAEHHCGVTLWRHGGGVGETRHRTWAPVRVARGVKPAEAHPIIAHLRSPGPHVRGCFVVDALLGKE